MLVKRCSVIQFTDFNPNEGAEEEDEDEGIWRAQRESNAWVEEQEALFKPNFCNRIKKIVKVFNQDCVMCMKKILLFMHLVNAVSNVCVKNVMNLKVLQIYSIVYFEKLSVS